MKWDYIAAGLGAICCVKALVLCHLHLVVEFLAFRRHLYSPKQRDNLRNILVILDILYMYAQAIPHMMTVFLDEKWVLGRSLCLIVMYLEEILPAQSMSTVIILIFSEAKLVPRRVVYPVCLVPAVLVSLLSVHLLLHSGLHAGSGGQYCSVTFEWELTPWLDFITYVLGYNIAFLVAPSLICIIYFIVAISRRTSLERVTVAVALSFILAFLPRMVLQICWASGVRFSLSFWTFDRFIPVYRLWTLPVIFLLDSSVLKRFRMVLGSRTQGSYTCSTLDTYNEIIRMDSRTTVDHTDSGTDRVSLDNHLEMDD